MKRVYILSLSTALLISSVSSFAQQNKQPEKAKVEKVKAGFGVTVVQTQPEFPGGQDSLVSFIKKNITYPKKSLQTGVEGRLYVGFLVTSEGKIKDVRVLSSINDELDAEAIRVVQMMPDWKPGYRGGSAVDVQYILSFDFVLPKKL